MKNAITVVLVLISLAYTQDSAGTITTGDKPKVKDSITTAAAEDSITTPAAKDTIATIAEEDSAAKLPEESIPTPVEEERLTTLAIMDFRGQNVAKDVAASLADRFRYELMETNKFEVMERAQMYMILEEQEFQKSDCVDQTCAVEAGQLIAVQKIVSGVVAKVGGIYTVNAKLLDVGTGRIDMNISEDCDCPIEKVLTETMKRLAYKMAGLKVEERKMTITVQRGDASLFLKTKPEDASVYLNGKLMDGRTPVTFENLTPGKHTILVKKADFQASKDIELISNQVVRISLKLEKQKTVLKITSTPSEAEVYLNAKRTLNTKPSQLTPAIFYDITPGKHKISLFKIGYADTIFSIDIKEFETNNFPFDLQELNDDKQIVMQKKFVKQRSQRKSGRIMIFSSIGIAAAGGVLLYLAQQDYNEAMDAKEVLDVSSIKSGPEYERLLNKNSDKKDAGDLKTNISIGMFGAAGLCGGLGLVLYF